MATRMLRPFTSSLPAERTWMAARWTTRWKPTVGLGVTSARLVGVGNFGVEEAVELAADGVDVAAGAAG